jgi:hypothetical protein
MPALPAGVPPELPLARGNLLLVGTGAIAVTMLPAWAMALRSWYGRALRVCLTHSASRLVNPAAGRGRRERAGLGPRLGSDLRHRPAPGARRLGRPRHRRPRHRELPRQVRPRPGRQPRPQHRPERHLPGRPGPFTGREHPSPPGHQAKSRPARRGRLHRPPHHHRHLRARRQPQPRRPRRPPHHPPRRPHHPDDPSRRRRPGRQHSRPASHVTLDTRPRPPCCRPARRVQGEVPIAAVSVCSGRHPGAGQARVAEVGQRRGQEAARPLPGRPLPEERSAR